MYVNFASSVSTCTNLISKTQIIIKMVTQDARGIIYGDLNFSIPSHMNIGKMMIDEMLKTKDKVALINGVTGEQIKFGELVQLIVNTAGALIRFGVKRDEVLGVCSENRTEFLITAIAGWCCGASVTFLNSAYSQSEMVHTMKISMPKYMFLSPDTYKNYYETMNKLNIVDKFFIFGDTVDNPKLLKFNDITKTHVDVDTFYPVTDIDALAHTALILYSSGTTGLPKGVMLTHLNLITTARHPSNVEKLLTCLSIAPWTNTVGIILALDELSHHRTIVYLPRFKEEQYLSCIQKYKVGALLTVPPLVVMLSKSSIIKNYDVSSVEIIHCGGAPLDLGVMSDIKKSFPNLRHVLQGYGMTETSGGLIEESETAFRPGSIGKVLHGNMIKVVDVETGKILGPNQEGELCVKGPALFAGYIGKNPKDEKDEEGFFKTGDICYYDKDGFFYIVDRIKELIKYKAGQVAPSELEGILLQHPDVKDVGVVGKPDTLVGELPTAFVVKKPGSKVKEQELIDFVTPKVSSWKQLRGGVYFIDEIPKTPSGKILRRILRDYLKKPVSKL